MQMKLYFLKQGVFQFVDGALRCSPPHIATTNGFSLQVNPYFFSLETTRSTYSKCTYFFSSNTCTASCYRLLNLALYLAYSWARTCFFIQFIVKFVLTLMNKITQLNVVIGILLKLVLLFSNGVKPHYDFGIMCLNPQCIFLIVCILLS
jgi:hypothetical protein